MNLQHIVPLLMSGGGLYTLQFLDQFTTDRADTSAINGTNAEPGPGTRIAEGDDAYLSITGEQLVVDVDTANQGDPAYHNSAAFARTLGRAYVWQATPASTSVVIRFGGDDTSSGFPTEGLYFVFGGNINAIISADEAGGVESFTNTTYQIAVVMRTAGAQRFIKGGAFSSWTRIWTDDQDTTDMHIAMGSGDNVVGSTAIDFCAIVDLLGGWSADNRYTATDYKASASADDTLTMTADAEVKATITAATGETQELSVRRTDDDNRIVVRLDETANTVKIIEIDGGSETELDSAAYTQNDGTDYIVTCRTHGTDIQARVREGGVISHTLVSATSSVNQSATGAKISHACADFEAWPLTLTDVQAAGLDAVVSQYG